MLCPLLHPIIRSRRCTQAPAQCPNSNLGTWKKGCAYINAQRALGTVPRHQNVNSASVPHNCTFSSFHILNSRNFDFKLSFLKVLKFIIYIFILVKSYNNSPQHCSVIDTIYLPIYYHRGGGVFQGSLGSGMCHLVLWTLTLQKTKGAFLWDDPDQDQWSKITRIMVDQMNQWILVQSGFIGSFDLPWSDQSDLGSLILIQIISKERTQKFMLIPWQPSHYFKGFQSKKTLCVRH